MTSGQRALPNNALIIADTYNRISEFHCLSSSTSSEVGQLLSPAGKDITFVDSDHFLVHRGGIYDPGLVHVFRIVPLSNEEQGVYTCRIPNEKGVAVDINVGLYLNESAGKIYYCHVFTSMGHVKVNNMHTQHTVYLQVCTLTC